MSSYASVAAHNAPPPERQPQPDPALLNTESPSHPNLADDTAKLNIVAPDFKQDPHTFTSESNIPVDQEETQNLLNGHDNPTSPRKVNKRKPLAEEEAEDLWTTVKKYLIRPGVAGGLIGLVNIGLIASVGRAFYTQPHLRRDSRTICSVAGASIALLSIEGYAAEQYRQTPYGRKEEERARKEGALIFQHLHEQILRPRVLGGAVGIVNTAILGTIGYFSYANWDRTWDKRLVSAVTIGILALWSGEGQAGDSDSDSSSDSEESMSSGEDEAPQKPAITSKQPAMSRFLRTAGSDSSDSDSDSDEDESDSDGDRQDDDESEEDEDKPTIRILSAVDKRLKEMEATGKAMENAVKINDWMAISNEFDKLVRMVQRQHNLSEPIPAFYIRTLVNLETSINTALQKEKEAKKKMNVSNAKALTAMKQKIKKAIKDNESEVRKYQEDPEVFEREYLALISRDAAPATAPRAARTAAGATSDQVDEFTTVGKGGKAQQYTSESIFKDLQAVQEARGKKNTDRAEQIRILEILVDVAATSYQRIRVLLALISSRFDYNSSISSHMPTELWLSAQREVDQLVSIVAADPNYSIQEMTEDYDELVERTPATEKGIVRIRGSIISFVDRLDDEFTRSLQNIDPHGTEYVDRLKDEKVLYCTICRAQAFYEKTSQSEPLGRVVMRRLEHIYSKPDAVVQALEAAADSSEVQPSMTLAKQKTTSALVHSLCVYLYKSGNSLLRTRAMLSHIYHHALHNDFHTARDMLLMSHLQESIHSADVATQILYNRTVVQLGLCAFRSGLIKEAQTTLQDIFTTQRVKELLAQGVHQQRFQVMTPEQEKAEKQRQLPFHMHINTELLEAAFLVSSMLVEIPLLASIDSEEQKRKVISKPFRRLLDFADRQVFTGPPESTRDHIMQASKALQDGEWEKCRDLIQSIKIWSLMPEAAKVKEMLAKRIQEQGLRTYLFTYAPHYSTLSLSLLSRTFSLPLRAVTSIVSKMIWNEELSASLDQSGGVVVFHRIELSRSQQLAQIISEKVAAMVDQNEKTLDIRMGGTGGWGERNDGNKNEKRGEQTQERRGRGERTRGARGGARGRGARFSQGLGNQMPNGQRGQ
ncbi:Eukaryotic translation initiation factor 3 subunit C [Psilocybe cubensis]|uniref:Eukaryotic translation initiation factor 3 subunit C n=2 Tax=Psilocybe cubensis TaxID=181762 RepID=A0ACB8HBF5_PSICU|nr:Eukaryotic translation initiation factor 3 subunit C [Psilocybe cubensis]KAH9485328.1 Eukaryotic translation initiation factor 3 subunit C [Psilocybe cubensis]